MKMFLHTVLLGILLLMTGCYTFVTPKEQGAGTEGKIFEIRESDKAQAIEGAILVGGSFWVTVTGKTRIFVSDNDKKTDKSFKDLRVDKTVRVVFSGPVRESFPAQAEAKTIEILD